MPLHRSARFLPVMVANLEIVAGIDGVEVLISDRHGYDDALEQLRDRFGRDRRFRFFAERDGIDWVRHYNALLAEGRGEYFAWMPHDDTFPLGWYEGLCAHLDARPAAILAFGRLIGIDERGEEPHWTKRCRSRPAWCPPDGSWTAHDAGRMLASDAWLPFRGVFRLDAIRRAGLTILPIHRHQGADSAWVFAAGLLGPITWADEVPACMKRFYPGSASRAMPFSLRSQSSMFLRCLQYARRHSRSRREALSVVTAVFRAYVAKVVVARLPGRLVLWVRNRRSR